MFLTQWKNSYAQFSVLNMEINESFANNFSYWSPVIEFHPLNKSFYGLMEWTNYQGGIFWIAMISLSEINTS